jgi:predicted nucleic acid-binding protein
MSGKGYLLDTNAIIQFLNGNKGLVDILARADFIATSIVAEMEFLSFSGLGENDLTILTADDHFKKLKTPWKVQLFVPDPPRM